MAQSESGEDKEPIVIKKYANRRLYNTATSSYVTLDHLSQMVKAGDDFVVYDARSGEDITRSVLTQIIFEEEAKGQNLLPIRFLRQLIRFYDDSLQALLPGYLEVSMESFARNQQQMRDYLDTAFGKAYPFRHLEEMSRQNLAMFQRAMSMFGTFAGTPAADQAENAAGADEEAPVEDEIAELRRKMAEMERELDALAKKK